MTQWRVCVYPTHESILAIDEIYGTQKEAQERLCYIENAIANDRTVMSEGPKPGTRRVLAGRHIVGAMMFEVDERWPRSTRSCRATGSHATSATV